MKSEDKRKKDPNLARFGWGWGDTPAKIDVYVPPEVKAERDKAIKDELRNRASGENKK